MKLNTKQIGAAIATATAGVELYRQGKEFYNKKTIYRAKVEDDSYVYPELMEWINTFASSAKQFLLKSEFKGVNRYYDSERSMRVMLDGHPLSVIVESDNAVADNGFSMVMKPQKSVIFSSRNPAAIVALQDFMQELTEEKRRTERPPQLHNFSNYWEGKRLPPRPLESVIMREGVKENLVADFERFLAAEKDYMRMGMPWHRGYMLHGEPGNGKTSLILAMAHNYNKNLFSMPLSNVENDKALSKMIADMDSNSILLIEDIDIFSKSMRRESIEKGPTLAGLLNALDGVHTPHGMVTFITTNREDTLDPALVRPGRIDYKLRLDGPDANQIRKAYKHVFMQDLPGEPKEFGSMADLMGIMKANHDNPAAAAEEIVRV